METFGPTSGRIGFDAAQAKQAEKQVLGKPLFVALSAEVFHEPLDFFAANGVGERGKKIGRTEVRIVLGNFVFEDKMVSERIPGEFANHAMVLMEVVAKMSKDQIGGELFF